MNRARIRLFFQRWNVDERAFALAQLLVSAAAFGTAVALGAYFFDGPGKTILLAGCIAAIAAAVLSLGAMALSHQRHGKIAVRRSVALVIYAAAITAVYIWLIRSPGLSHQLTAQGRKIAHPPALQY